MPCFYHGAIGAKHVCVRDLIGLGLLLTLLPLAGCDRDHGTCETTCTRVARCRLLARQGKPIEGERKPAPDARCMKRCEEGSEAFNKCEGKHRTCAKLRGCLGPLR